MTPSTQAFAALNLLILVGVLLWAGVHHDTMQDPDQRVGPAVSTGLRINVNTDDAATLTLLPGVGPGIAQHIVDARDDGRVFARVEDLEPVKFIGPSVIRRVGPWVKFSGGGDE